MKRPYFGLGLAIITLICLVAVGCGSGAVSQETTGENKEEEPATLGELREKYGGAGQPADTSTLERAFGGVWQCTEPGFEDLRLYIGETVIVACANNNVPIYSDYRIMEKDEAQGTLKYQYVMTHFVGGAAWSTAGTEEAEVLFSQDRNKWQYAFAGGRVFERVK